MFLASEEQPYEDSKIIFNAKNGVESSTYHMSYQSNDEAKPS